MSDLSRLLDDVYGGTPQPGWTTEPAETLAGWQAETTPDEPQHLEVVADPVVALEAILDLGPVVAHTGGHDAPVVGPPEPAATSETPETHVPPGTHVPAGTFEPVATFETSEIASVVREAAIPSVQHTWAPSDDDILPARGRRLRLLGRRRR